MGNSVKFTILKAWSSIDFFAEQVCYQQCDQKKSPNVYKSCPKMISLEKLIDFDIFTKNA